MSTEITLAEQQQALISALVSVDDEGNVFFHVDPNPMVVRAQIIALKDRLLANVPAQVEFAVEHQLVDGMYIRKMRVKKGEIVVGKIHLKSCINFVESGDISVVTETGKMRVQAGYMIASPAGLQKVGYAHEDTVFVNVFRTDKVNVDEIEAEIACESFDIFDAQQGALCL